VRACSLGRVDSAPPFQLCATLAGHEQDVRSVSALSSGEVLTGSRDMSVRLWKTDKDPSSEQAYTCAVTLLGHSHFVGAVSPAGTGAASGSNDKHVIEWDLAAGTPLRILEGHTDVISCVRAAASGDTLFSASWDKTARVWQQGACVRTLIGHEAAVWSVLPLEDGRVLTASADRTIKLWAGEETHTRADEAIVRGTCVTTFSGHEDVVRDLALVPGVGFVSASNDGTIRAWELGGSCIKVIRASETFVYSVVVLGSGEWMTCSEDRTVRIWNAGTGECVQSISHPSTVWACSALPNGDLAAGCADGNAYVWTRQPDRTASAELIAAFKETVASTSLPAQQAEGMVEGGDGLEFVDEEALAEPGIKEGQQKFVKDANGTKWLYQWSGSGQNWEKIGEITGQNSSEGAALGKKIFEGKEWDFVFDIDLHGPGAPPAQIPFNRGDDPWMAAQQFLWKHELDQGFLEQVANHITQNTPGNVVQTGGGNVDPFTAGGSYQPGGSSGGGAGGSSAGNSDPFTSGGAYRPGGSSGGAGGSSGGNSDPFTSGGAYRPGNATAPAPAPAAPAAPASAYAQFDTCKHDAALGKLLEFNSSLGGAATPLGDADVAALTAMVEALKGGGGKAAITAAHVALFTGGGGGGGGGGAAGASGLLAWPAKSIFPALDLLRLVLLQPSAAAHVAAAQPPLLPRLAALLGADADKPTTLTVLRCFANALYNEPLRPTAAAAASAIMDTLATPIESGATGVRLAACTALVNLSSALAEGALAQAGGDADALQLQALSLCAHALSVGAFAAPAEEEALYRVLVALAALLGIGASTLDVAHDLDVGSALQALQLPPSAAPKVKSSLAGLVATMGKRSKA